MNREERELYATLNPARIPEHIAIIMDGNGRWAGKRALERFMGHQQGAKSVRSVTETAARIGLKWLTLYAFSLENSLRRPKAEINFLMRLLKTYLETNTELLMENNVRLQFIGRTRELPQEIQDKMRWASEMTGRNTGTTLTLALNYGSRPEIVDAVKAIAQKVKEGKLDPAQLTEEDVHDHLYTANMPDPDLLIRSSGEMRVSNFLLWQIAYTELYITDLLWPDFKGINLLEAIADFQKRERRYGGLGEGDRKTDETIEPVNAAGV
jgi:undecaprenyl diphosphate synthase